MNAQDPDKPEPIGPDTPFTPIVESLLKYPLDSPEFADALSVAGPAECADVLRQLKQTEALWNERIAALQARQIEILDEREDDD